MRIVFLGAPGAGKGTQAQFFMEKYGITKISIGDLLRISIRSRSGLGKKAEYTMNAGELVTNELVIPLVKKRITQKDCYNGFLLDGFPRTIPQAEAMKKEKIDIDYVLEFDVLDEVIINRIIGRRIHMSSGRVYHIKFNPPKVEGIDDITKEELLIRKDDKEDIIRKRLAEYHRITKPLISFYKKEAQAGNIKYAKINGNKTIEEVREELEQILSKNF